MTRATPVPQGRMLAWCPHEIAEDHVECVPGGPKPVAGSQQSCSLLQSLQQGAPRPWGGCFLINQLPAALWRGHWSPVS